ncbi:MAG TPA: MFS transporter, partial [Myxococcales bacterium]|nr:MFS transporter [Myxococcales bacterium]
AAGLSLLSILGTTFLLPSVPPHPAGEQPAEDLDAPAGPGGKRLKLLDWGAYVQYFRRPLLGGLLAEFFLFTFAFATFTSGFALFAERRFTWHGAPFGPKEVGYVFMYSGLLGILVQGSMRQGALVRRIGEVRLVTIGFAAAAAGYALLGFSFGVAALLVAATFSSFGTGVLRPALTSLITQQVTRSEQGVVLGLNQSLLSIAQIVAPAIAGALIESGYLISWALWAAVVLGFALLLNLRARGERQKAVASAESGSG